MPIIPHVALLTMCEALTAVAFGEVVSDEALVDWLGAHEKSASGTNLETITSRFDKAITKLNHAAATGHVTIFGGRPGSTIRQRIEPHIFFEFPMEWHWVHRELSPKGKPDALEFKRAGDWERVQIDRDSFQRWFRGCYRDLLIDQVQHGFMPPDDAEAKAADEGCEPLATQPDPALFDPMTATYWSLPMAIAWIASYDLSSVRQQWKRYRDVYTYWLGQSIQVPGQAIQRGHFIQRLPPANVSALICSGGWRENAFFSEADSQRLADAQTELWDALARGELQATGARETDNQRVEIQAFEWQDLHWLEVKGRDLLRREPKYDTRGYADGSVAVVDVVRLWPSNPSQSSTVVDARHKPRVETAIVETSATVRPNNIGGERYRRIVTKIPTDRQIIVAVLEELMDSGDNQERITEIIRHSASSLGHWPSDIDEQGKLVDRVRRNVRKQQRTA